MPYHSLPYEETPDKEWLLLHSRHTLNHSGRLHLARFLWGNGIDPATIGLVLLPLVKVQSEKDIKGIIDVIASRKYDNSWWYFSVRYQINLLLNDHVKDPLEDDGGECPTLVFCLPFEFENQHSKLPRQ
jgi:hypothetical protein